jgi:hypothetical protein
MSGGVPLPIREYLPSIDLYCNRRKVRGTAAKGYFRVLSDLSANVLNRNDALLEVHQHS